MPRNKPDIYYEFKLREIVYQSPKAYLVKLIDHDEEIWIPKSQSDLCEESMVIHIKEWLVKEKGIDHLVDSDDQGTTDAER